MVVVAIGAFTAVNVGAQLHVPSHALRVCFNWVEAAARSRRGVEEVRHAVDVGAVNVFMLASAGVGVEFEATGADLVEALAVVCLEAVVETNWALAVFREAAALSGVPVETIFASLVWRAEARTVDMVEVLSIKTRVCGVFNALA